MPCDFLPEMMAAIREGLMTLGGVDRVQNILHLVHSAAKSISPATKKWEQKQSYGPGTP